MTGTNKLANITIQTVMVFQSLEYEVAMKEIYHKAEMLSETAHTGDKAESYGPKG